MAKTKVKLKLDPNIDPRVMFNKRFQSKIGSEVVIKMKEFIAAGISPVKGVGRFEAYAAQRGSGDKNPKRLYPLSIKSVFASKQVRPVNLKLSGSFIDTIRYDAETGFVEIGHIDEDKHTKALFEAHNEGLNKNVPKRKYLPNKRGEEFVATIMSLIKSIYSARIRSVLK